MKIQIKKLTEDAILPSHGSADAAGWDLYTLEGRTINAGTTALVGTGLAVAIPEGYVGLVFARSGLATKNGLAPANKVGVIDSDYRGELKVALHNHFKEMPQTISKGDRIAQMLVVPCVNCEWEEVAELSETERGVAGFGSTGIA